MIWNYFKERPLIIFQTKKDNIKITSDENEVLNSKADNLCDCGKQRSPVQAVVSPSDTKNEKETAWSTQSNGDNEKSIAEQVKEAAQSALQDTGMVYVESAGMYYDYKTGYYYNSVSLFNI